MAAITKITRKTGVRYRVTINVPGVRTFSRNFRTNKAARACHRIITLVCTIANMEYAGDITTRHLTEAMNYKRPDRLSR